MSQERGDIYFLLTENEGRTGRILPEAFLVQTERGEKEKVKTSKKLSFSFSIFPLYQPGINIAHNARGHYGKIRRVIYLRALAI